MKNEDFFTALASVDAKFPIYEPAPPSYFIKPHAGPYYCTVYMQLSGCCVLYVHKNGDCLYKLFIAPTGRSVICQDIEYVNPGIMQYRPDELKRFVPFICGKFRTYQHFLNALKRAVWMLDKEFFNCH